MEQKQHQRHEISTEIIYLEPPVAIGYLCLAPTCELPSIRVNQYLAIPFLPIPPTTYPSLSPSSPIMYLKLFVSVREKSPPLPCYI